MLDTAQNYIEIRHLSKRFGTGGDAVLALQDIHVSLAKGSFVSVVGPSGCGKSTQVPRPWRVRRHLCCSLGSVPALAS